MSAQHRREETVRRIVVALDPSAEGVSALEFAADLAAALGISLAGVFIEDVDIAEFAELPFAREISLSGANVRGLSRQRMQSYYRTAAERTRRSLEELGRAHRIQYSFEWRRGRLEHELSAAAREWDVVVISTAAGHVVRPRGHDILGPLETCAAAGFIAFNRRVTPSAAAGVLAIFTGSEEARRAVALASRIAAQRHTTLTVLSTGAPGPEAEAAIRQLAAGAARLQIIARPGAPADQVRLHSPSPALVVIPADLAAADREAIRALDIPTLVIRAARTTGSEPVEHPS
jgi:hypothetical protein